MRDQWNGLNEQGIFEFGIEKNPKILEYDTIGNEAKKSGEEVHVGKVQGIMVEKRWKLPKEESLRKFKGRAVFFPGLVKLSCHFLKQRDGQISIGSCPRIPSCWQMPQGHTSKLTRKVQDSL